MKANLIIPTMLLFLAVGCAREAEVNLQEASGEVQTVEVIGPTPIQFEAITGNTPVTKGTSVQNGSALLFGWEVGDTLGIFPNLGNQVEFPITAAQGSTSASFDGGGWALRNDASYAAYYPFSVWNYHRDNETILLDYTGQVQEGNGSFAHLSAYDFLASDKTTSQNSSVTFQMTRQGAILYIDIVVPEPESITSLTIACDDAIFVEKAALDISGETPAVSPISTVKSLTLSFINTETTTNNETVRAYMAVQPVDFTEKTVTATLTTESGSYTAPVTSRAVNKGRAAFLRFSDDFAVNDCIPVDLGLSVKWASCNLGASVPEGEGNYYAWGETEPKDEYTWQNYLWGRGDKVGKENSLCKYNVDGWLGVVDELNKMSLEDDVARTTMGGLWRIPTFEEFMELRDKCDWRWTTKAGVKGYEVTGPNNNKIFLPAAGQWNDSGLINDGLAGEYWSSTVHCDHPGYAWSLSFNSDQVFNKYGKVSPSRSNGCSIRPVLGVATSGISLSNDGLFLYEGGVSHLTATLHPAGSYSLITWSSTNPSVATVNGLGDVRGVSSGSATINASIPDLGYVASCEVVVGQLESYNTDLVDLGLSVKWATCNLGAGSSEQSGFYYSYGETSPKCDYTWNTYNWYISSLSSFLTKYNTDSNLGIVDNLTVLDDEDDVAQVKLGGNWRSPSMEEFKELQGNCSWVWTTKNGVNGYEVTSYKYGFTDKSIFLPVTGYCYGVGLIESNAGYYASSSLVLSEPRGARGLLFDDDSVQRGEYSLYRNNGLAIRPVYDDGIRRNVTEVSLDQNTLSLNEGESAILSATVLPATANDKRIEWYSSDNSVATVSQEGVVKAIHEGSAEITVETVEGAYKATCSVVVHHIETFISDYVDLGLSVKWATCNLGAASPERYGNNYAWGEIESKIDFTWDNYKWCNGTQTSLTKYNSSADLGVVDNKSVLELDDDVAHVKLGGSWHIPTFYEMEELVNSCSWVFSSLNEVNGYEVIGPNGNSIFLPSIDYFTDYWSSSKGGVNTASCLALTSSNYWITQNQRFYGFQIRPVTE